MLSPSGKQNFLSSLTSGVANYLEFPKAVFFDLSCSQTKRKRSSTRADFQVWDRNTQVGVRDVVSLDINRFLFLPAEIRLTEQWCFWCTIYIACLVDYISTSNASQNKLLLYLSYLSYISCYTCRIVPCILKVLTKFNLYHLTKDVERYNYTLEFS